MPGVKGALTEIDRPLERLYSASLGDHSFQALERRRRAHPKLRRKSCSCHSNFAQRQLELEEVEVAKASLP